MKIVLTDCPQCPGLRALRVVNVSTVGYVCKQVGQMIGRVQSSDLCVKPCGVKSTLVGFFILVA